MNKEVWKYPKSVDEEFEQRVFNTAIDVCVGCLLDDFDVDKYVDAAFNALSSMTDESFSDTVTRGLMKTLVCEMQNAYETYDKKHGEKDMLELYEFLEANLSCDELLDDLYAMNGRNSILNAEREERLNF